MPSPLEQLFVLEAQVDAEGRLRLPDGVLHALRLNPGDAVRFHLGTDGSVRMESRDRATGTAARPAVPLLSAAALMLNARSGAAPQASVEALLRALGGTNLDALRPADSPKDPPTDPREG